MNIRNILYNFFLQKRIYINSKKEFNTFYITSDEQH